MGCKTKLDPVPQSSNDVTVRAAPGETIVCDAVIAGDYTTLDWSSPNNPNGSSLHYTTSLDAGTSGFVFGPGPVIRLQANWVGGADSKRVFIAIVAPQ
jgi:hypothetical protein